jgi:hypothetical protein
VATTLEVCEGRARSCNVCAQIKNPHHHLHGLLQPFPIPTSMWSSISMDFIIDLPPFSFYDSILVVVDCLTKMFHFIPYTKIIIGEGTSKLFFNHVFWYHGLLKDIIVHCGPQFAFKFWK